MTPIVANRIALGIGPERAIQSSNFSPFLAQTTLVHRPDNFASQDSGAFPVLHQFAGFASLFGFSAFISMSSSGVI